MTNAKLTITPMVSSLKLGANEGNGFVNRALYRGIMSALQYVTTIRHDIAFMVNKVSRYISQPKEAE